MEHNNLKQIAEVVGTVEQPDGTVNLHVRSTMFGEDHPQIHRYPREWELSKELLDITDPVHIMARLGLTDSEYDHWMAQLK
ncbi:MAG: hypothetical protein DRP09_16580 [Candidatus Thorarchaeota archaeon]|nr:MAG: hypothetical protein DRP09_16580 [Candidatus Thorarchaeota archaeon]